VEMHQQPNDYSCKSEAIGGRHFGPVMIYMCEVPDAKSSTGDCSWVKVAQDSYNKDIGEKSWGTEILNSKCGKKSVKIPSGLRDGQYILRAEALALHTAGQTGGAQFYVTCYQLSISGGGSKKLPAGVRLPGAYRANDPGIKVNIWSNLTTYKAPGPAVWSG